MKNPCKYILDVLYPRTCPVCKHSLDEGHYLCSDCMRQLDRTEQALQRDNETERYFAHLRHFVRAGCWLNYGRNFYVQKLIHDVKFRNGNPMVLYQLGREAALEWKDTGFFDGVDVMVPIPLHKGRVRKRGFNQSDWIARGLSEVLLIPMDTEHLQRIKATKMQSRAQYDERQMGVQGAFEVNHPEEWYGKTIMLVDDIITTGATMRAAIDAMEQVYGCKIVVWGLARAK